MSDATDVMYQQLVPTDLIYVNHIDYNDILDQFKEMVDKDDLLQE